MKIRYVLIGLTCLTANVLSAENWLPKTSQETRYRLLECIYQDAELKHAAKSIRRQTGRSFVQKVVPMDVKSIRLLSPPGVTCSRQA